LITAALAAVILGSTAAPALADNPNPRPALPLPTICHIGTPDVATQVGECASTLARLGK
jgi:hypothetical protein